MRHEPSGLLGYSEIAADFVATDAVLAVHYQPDGSEPFVQTDRRVFEDGPGLQREPGPIMSRVALPDTRLFEVGDVIGTAVRTLHLAIRPAQFHHELAAVF